MTIYLVTTENCGACKKLKNAMDYAGMIDEVEIKQIDTIRRLDMEFIKMYSIKIFPTLLKLDCMDELSRLEGLHPLSEIREFISREEEIEEETGEYEPDLYKEYIENLEE